MTLKFTPYRVVIYAKFYKFYGMHNFLWLHSAVSDSRSYRIIFIFLMLVSDNIVLHVTAKLIVSVELTYYTYNICLLLYSNPVAFIIFVNCVILTTLLRIPSVLLNNDLERYTTAQPFTICYA